MILLGVLLHIHILFVIGIAAAVIGLLLVVAGRVGHPVGGRAHYW